MAADLLAAQHVLFAVRLPARPTSLGHRFQVFDKSKDGVLSVLDPLLHNFTPLEFPDRALERRRAFR